MAPFSAFFLLALFALFPRQKQAAKDESLPSLFLPVFQIHFPAYRHCFAFSFLFSIHVIIIDLAREYCDLEVPSCMPSISPISTCVYPSTACKLKIVWQPVGNCRIRSASSFASIFISGFSEDTG